MNDTDFDTSAAARRWASGMIVAQYEVVRSPASGLMYERTSAAGSGTTDPSADTGNYSLVGPTRRKQLQYVNVTLVAGTGFDTATATIPAAVVAAKCRTRVVWGTQASNAWFGPAVPSITAPTTLSVNFGVAATGSNIVVRVEIDEDW